MKVLELFCGTKSISKAFEKAGHETFTIDNDREHDPDLCIDILNFEIDMLPKEWRKPDVIWASPPCQKFSVITLTRYWKNGKPQSWKTYFHLAIVKKTIELIKEINPKYWFIENPRAMLRKQHFMLKLPRKTVTYCQYGAESRKPTDIWTNAISWVPKKICQNGDLCHNPSPRAREIKILGIPSTDEKKKELRAIIPDKLCQEIVKVCESKQKTVQNTLK